MAANSLAAIPLFGFPGTMEWLIIAGVIILVFGASKLPKLGKGLGEGIRNFKTSIKGGIDSGSSDENDDSEKSSD